MTSKQPPLSPPLSPPTSSLPPLRAMDLEEMTTCILDAGESAFRAKQIFQWVYEKGVEDFDAMTNLSKNLRAWLAENCRLGGLTVAETVGEPDETQKIVFRTHDGEFIEAVLMRGEEDGDEADTPHSGSTPPRRRVSLCVSSQVGCALNCSFCMTGFGGFRRHLAVDEILDQVLTARRSLAPDEQLTNVVFMGMGEPMLNLDAVVPALQILTSRQAFAIPARRITVSTAGVVPGIDAFALAATEAELAVSLNATTQTTRNLIMPGLRKWPLADLLEACRHFPMSKRQRITFEYVLLDGVNDSDDDARRLVELVGDIRCKINLILFNPDPALELQPSSEERALAFRTLTLEPGRMVNLRRSKGRRHHAACGQLAAHMRTER